MNIKALLNRYTRTWGEFLPLAMVILGVIMAPIAGTYNRLPFKIGTAIYIVTAGTLAIYCYCYLDIEDKPKKNV